MEYLGFIIIIAAFMAGLFLLIMTILLPFVVWFIWRETQRINVNLENLLRIFQNANIKG